MRIAQLAPLFESVPPACYGGTERVIAALCDGLVARGHEVVLFAAGTSVSRAEVVEVVPEPLRMRMSRQELVEMAPGLHRDMLDEAYACAAQFDVMHSHADIPTLPFARSSEAPSVLTLHGRLDERGVRDALRRHPGVPLVSISEHQRRAVADLPVTWAATVYNGLELRHYGATDVPKGHHLAFAGRIHPEKGPAAAVEVARRTGRQLRVAAKIDPLDADYYRVVIEPLFAACDVEFLGELGEHDKPEFFAGAAATLFPSDWPEPFGLVMIESMAAGTPVIALRRGSVPEVIVDGVTGFICDDLDQMADAVGHLADIDPAACRRHASCFSQATMCARYERVYERLIGEHSASWRAWAV